MSRVIVIGIDGGTFDLMGPWIKQGHMPVLASLINEGVSGELDSTRPPLTCPAWWTFSTGKNPGRFGSYHFWQLAPSSYDIRRSKSYGPGTNMELWDLLNEAGYRCGIVNNPIMFPPAKIRDYSVAGCFASVKADYTFPSDFRNKLDEIAGGYELDSLTGEDKSDEQTILDCDRVLEKRRKVMVNLLAAEDRPEFFLGVLTESDRMCHRFLNQVGFGSRDSEIAEERLLEFFKKLDTAIGNMVDKLDSSDYIIVMSDHGFGNRDKGFYINEWLRQQGYLNLKAKPGGGSIKGTLRRKISDALSRLGLTDLVKAKVPRSLLVRFAPVGTVEGEGKSIFDYIQNGLIDWTKTKAVALPDGLIYLNTEDRPNGTISAGKEYDLICEELIAKLGSISDDEGRPLKAEVSRKEDVYEGDFLAEAPDLYLVIGDYGVAAFPNLRDSEKLMGPLSLAGHRQNGMIIVKGPGIKQGEKMEPAGLIDLAPTILHIMGVPVPDDMDGRVLRGLFIPGSEMADSTDSFQEARYREKGAEVPMGEEDSEDDEEIKKRLEELGYL